jgi:hypothetical protein
MNTYREKLEKKTDLIDKLYEYLQNTDLNEELEVKSGDIFYTNDKVEEDNLEQLNLDYSTALDKQLDNISNNIVSKFFSLNEEKFQAVMDRINLWRI